MRGATEAELDELCRHRAQERTEIFLPNAWYGAARALRDYCAWPAQRPIPVVLPHGVELSADFLYAGETSSRLNAIYSFPAYRDAVYANRSTKRVIPGAAPWLYVPRAQAAAARDVVLLMPAHSSVGIQVEMSDAQFIDVARERFPNENLHCCMYWHDVQLGRHRTYFERGIPVITAGHVFDADFFQRLAALFVEAKLMVTNEFGSHVYYAASHDVPVVVLQNVEVVWTGTEQRIASDCATGPFAPQIVATQPLFTTDHPDLTRQRQAALSALGAERRHSPDELYGLFNEIWQSASFQATLLRWRLGGAMEPARSYVRSILDPSSVNG